MSEREITATESDRSPLLSILLGWGAMAPFPALALAALAVPEPASTAAALYGGAILAFLAGVRRGVSFRQPGGPTPGQIAIMGLHFAFALGALALVVLGYAAVSAGVLCLAYASLAVTDRRGAEKGTMPLHFARLRPAQSALATISLAATALLA